MSKLKGKVAVVTGSSKGIGEGGKRMAAENSLIDSAPGLPFAGARSVPGNYESLSQNE